jgi:hypothetical protein
MKNPPISLAGVARCCYRRTDEAASSSNIEDRIEQKRDDQHEPSQRSFAVGAGRVVR